MLKEGVPQDVRALNALLVAFVMRIDFRVELGHERVSALVGPEVVRPVLVHRLTALDRRFILRKRRRPAFGQEDLVNDLRRELAIALCCGCASRLRVSI